MGVYEARGSLGKAYKELLLRWAEARSNWDDANARFFEEKFLGPIEQDLKQAIATMDTAAVLLSQIRRDCQ